MALLELCFSEASRPRGTQWKELPIWLVQSVGSGLAPRQRLELRALDHRARDAGGALEWQRFRIEDRSVLSATGGAFYSSLSTLRSQPESIRGDHETPRRPGLGMNYSLVRRCRSLLRSLLDDIREDWATARCDAVVDVVERLTDMEQSLGENAGESFCDMARALDDCLVNAQSVVPADSAAGLLLGQLALGANRALLNCEVPELLYMAPTHWPVQQSAEALVLLLEARLELGVQLTPKLAKRWVWLEVGILDNEGIDAVPRVCCHAALHEGEPSNTVLVRHRLAHGARREFRFLQGLTRLVLAGSGEHRLAVWARADGPSLFGSSLEVHSASLELLCNSH